MNKQILGLLTAVSLTAAPAAGAFAADKANAEPDVYVNESLIMFEDQNAKIIDDVTLVPARGVFEAMGCRVEWDEDNKTVTVKSENGVRYIVLEIGNTNMSVYTYKSIMARDSYDYTLEVPAQIINDRTMIPLRAVSEAFNCTVTWDDNDYCVNITTGAPFTLEGYENVTSDESEKTKISLSAEPSDVKSGDMFDIYIDVANIPDNNFLSAVIASFSYDKSLYEYVSGTLLTDEDTPFSASLSFDNTEYYCGTKAVYITIDETNARKNDGHVFKATFKALTDKSGTIALNNNYTPPLSFETQLTFTSDINGSIKDTTYEGQDLIVDKTPVVINAAE